MHPYTCPAASVHAPVDQIQSSTYFPQGRQRLSNPISLGVLKGLVTVLRKCFTIWLAYPSMPRRDWRMLIAAMAAVSALKIC